MKGNQLRPRIELVSPCPFPTTITFIPRAPPVTSYQVFNFNSNNVRTNPFVKHRCIGLCLLFSLALSVSLSVWPLFISVCLCLCDPPLSLSFSLSLSLSLCLCFSLSYIYIECSPIVWEIWVQFPVESYQKFFKWYLIPSCITLSNIRYVSRVKWSNPGKE